MGCSGLEDGFGADGDSAGDGDRGRLCGLALLAAIPSERMSPLVALIVIPVAVAPAARTLGEAERRLRRPDRFRADIAPTAAVPGTTVFLAGRCRPRRGSCSVTALALPIDCPSVDAQRQRIDAHANVSILMSSILFAARAFPL